MKIELVLDKDRIPVGYNIVPETDEDDKTVATIRNLVFTGFDEDLIQYDGFNSKDPSTGKKVGNIASLNFLKAKFCK